MVGDSGLEPRWIRWGFDSSRGTIRTYLSAVNGGRDPPEFARVHDSLHGRLVSGLKKLSRTTVRTLKLLVGTLVREEGSCTVICTVENGDPAPHVHRVQPLTKERLSVCCLITQSSQLRILPTTLFPRASD